MNGDLWRIRNIYEKKSEICLLDKLEKQYYANKWWYGDDSHYKNTKQVLRFNSCYFIFEDYCNVEILDLKSSRLYVQLETSC